MNNKETHYFIIKEDGIYWIEKMPGEPYFQVFELYCDRFNKALQTAIDSAIKVANQDDVKNAIGDIIDPHNKPIFESGVIYPLQCRVETYGVDETGNSNCSDDNVVKELARVTFDEQPEKKDNVAPTQVETYAGTLHIGGDALGWQRDLEKWIDNEKRGIPPISGREKAWRLRRAGIIEQEAAGQEQEVKDAYNAGLMCERILAKDEITSLQKQLQDRKEENERLKASLYASERLRKEDGWNAIKEANELRERISQLEKELKALNTQE